MTSDSMRTTSATDDTMPDFPSGLPIVPDALSGIIFAFEGIDRTCVLLNGPTGCKFFHSAISDGQRIRQRAFDPLDYPPDLFFGQPRVPCTYLDTHDYVYGSREKLEEAVTFLRDHVDFDLLAVVNSPGAALIGDDLRGIVKRILPDRSVVTMQTPGFSSDLCHGFEVACEALFEQLDIPADEPSRTVDGVSADMSRDGSAGRARTVNILGLSLYHRDHEGDAAELTRLLGLCGIDVNCILCEDCDLESIRAVPAASLNIVVHPEYGASTARFLKERFGTPFLIFAPPVGFDATEAFVREVCDTLDTDPSGALEDSERARARAFVHISRFNSLTGLPKGVRFSAEGTCSELFAYTSFLCGYFGMVAASLSDVTPRSDRWRNELEALVARLGVTEALSRDVCEADSELVFASGETIARARLARRGFCGIEISLPSLGYVDVIPKTHLGVNGALLLTEQVLNGMVY